METNKCKNIKCIHGEDGINDEPLHVNIKYDTLINKSHLYCLILYCDYTYFCNSFLLTFRRITFNESIESIKQRHSKYYYFAKHLTELIQYYGITGNWEYDNYENGPFYIGISCCVILVHFSWI